MCENFFVLALRVRFAVMSQGLMNDSDVLICSLESQIADENIVSKNRFVHDYRRNDSHNRSAMRQKCARNDISRRNN